MLSTNQNIYTTGKGLGMETEFGSQKMGGINKNIQKMQKM